VYAIFGLPVLAMMPVIARDVLGTGAAGYGLLLTCVGIGALIGALSLATLGRRMQRGRLLVLSSYGFAVLLIVFSVVFSLHIHSLLVAAIILLGVGFMMLLNGALANGLLQSIVPDELRGRIISAYVFVYVGMAPIGSFLAGAVADALNVQWAIGGGATAMLLYALWSFRRHPELQAV
jgi:MFS family permease